MHPRGPSKLFHWPNNDDACGISEGDICCVIVSSRRMMLLLVKICCISSSSHCTHQMSNLCLIHTTAQELGCSESFLQGSKEGCHRQSECCHSGESEPSRSVSQVTDQPPLLHLLALHKPSLQRSAVEPSIQRTQSPFTAQKFEQIAAGHIRKIRQACRHPRRLFYE